MVHVTSKPPSLETIESVLTAAGRPMLLIDADSLIRVVNRALATFLGYAPEELLGQPVDLLVPPERTSELGTVRSAWQERPPTAELGTELDLHALHRDGRRIPVDVHAAPMSTAEGPMALVTLLDVHEHRHDSRLFRGLLEAAPDAIIIADQSRRIRMINKSAERMFGYQRSELLGQPVEVLVPDRFADHHRKLGNDFSADPHLRPMGQAKDLLARRRDGTEFPAEVSLAPVRTDEGVLIVTEVRDITERLAARDAVRAAEQREQAHQEAERAKDEFVANISHELRTPLTSMLGFAEMIPDIEDLSPECEHFLSIITRNARRELRLVEDLLTLVDIDRERLAVHLQEADLASLVGDAVEVESPRAAELGIELHLDVPSTPLIATFDSDRIGQVIDNLLSNALKFTPTGGSVSVRLRATPDLACIEVTDTGIGIGGEAHDRIFERLYRSPIAVEHEIPGAGIGLSIAAALVCAHDGRIRVLRSNSSGTTIAFEIPRHLTPTENPAAPDERAGAPAR